MIPSQNDTESRFGYLLQPIRDLAKNWEVDIANYLEDYLEQLEKISFSFDGGTSMNFAEAAMLIQGSACVYSRKVEHLYTLVYQVLDLLASKKQVSKAGSADDGKNDMDVTFRDDEHEEFLLLDDIRIQKNLSLKNDSAESVHVMPCIPLSLISFGDGEKGEEPLLSHNGEVLGSRKDFKMNTSILHTSGAMLLEVSDLLLADEAPQGASGREGAVVYEKPPQHLDSEVNAQMSSVPDVKGCSLSGFGGDDPTADDDDVENMADVPLALQRSKRTCQTVKAAPGVIKTDPWALLDPHNPGKAVEKPFRKGKTFSLPAGLQQKNSKKRKKTAEVRKTLEPISDFLTKAFFSHEHKLPKAPIKALCLKEFTELYWAELKSRQAKKQSLRKTLVKVEHQNLLDKNEEEDDAVSDVCGGSEDGEDNLEGGLEPFSDHLGDELFGTDTASNFGNVPTSRLNQRRSGLNIEEGLVVDTYEALVQKHVEAYMISAEQYAQITDLSKRISEWKEKIIPRLKEEASVGGVVFRTRYLLHIPSGMNVTWHFKNWRKEMHGPFDIHEYGTQILNSLTECSSVLFSKIVAGKPVYEISRLFLASLMLANTRNIDISCPAFLEEGMDKMQITLLSNKRHFQELGEYKVPSLAASK